MTVVAAAFKDGSLEKLQARVSLKQESAIADIDFSCLDVRFIFGGI